MTQSDFIRGYCGKSGTTEELLNRLGRFAFPCSCDYEGCEGWQMGNADQVEHDLKTKRAWTMTWARKLLDDNKSA